MIMGKQKNCQNFILSIIKPIQSWFSNSQLAYAEVKSYGNTPFRPTGIYQGRLQGRGYANTRCRH